MSAKVGNGMFLIKVVHGWHIDNKSLTACGLGWIYGRHAKGKEPLGMVDDFTRQGITCKRCLKSKNLRVDGEEEYNDYT